MYQSLFIGAMESALNQYIRLDPDYQTYLSPLQDKVILLIITPPDLKLYIIGMPDRFQILSHYAGEADTTIQASMRDLIAASYGAAQKQQLIFSEKLTINGNTGVGNAFSQLLEKLDIDWEEHASHLLGDVVAHQLFKQGSRALHWQQQLANKLVFDVTDFLQFESRDLADTRDVRAFTQQVSDLRADSDRLMARLTRLRKNIQLLRESRQDTSNTIPNNRRSG